MTEKNLSEQEIINVISLEYSLSKKRSENEAFEAKFNFGNCRICNSEATGIHYGVCSCEGCKGFFKRSLVRHTNYICRNNKNCVIHPKDTRKCKYCRWMACLRSGMSLSHVRVGRIPNFMKEIRPKNNPNQKKRTNKFCLFLKYMKNLDRLDQQFKSEFENFMPKNFYAEKYLNCSTQNQIIIFSSLRDKSNQIYVEQTMEFREHEIKAQKLILSKYVPIKVEKGSDLARELRKKDTILMEKHARSMFEFVKQLPGFQKVNANDLGVIIKEKFFSVYALRTIKLFIKNEFYFMYDDIPMTSEIFALLTSDIIRDVHFKFYLNFQMLDLNIQEIALTVPVILTMLSSVSRLENPEIIQEIREYYLKALLYQFSLKNRSQNFIEAFFKIVLLTPVIDKLCQELDFEEQMQI